MKNIFIKAVFTLLLLTIISCQNNEDEIIPAENTTTEETLIDTEKLIEENELKKENLSPELKNDILQERSSIRRFCSIFNPIIPIGYRVLYYENSVPCDFTTFPANLYLGLYNTAVCIHDPIIIPPSTTPLIKRAGSGCDDHYCIWILGKNFDDNSYVDVRTKNGSEIIASYRGADRVLTTSGADQLITVRFKTEFERREFATRGLRIWVVNPDPRKWADGRLIKRFQ
ncbi:hypothetical protein [Tenacibaculum agarivorans]|uniref:hypothetical protein n=1 Tax=Tenacibaculum agarivorans TaxID=1908389 RepID=UPI00117CEC8A|nr:hypothetical protein [Tenacibaculum agarivorans]